ILDVIPGTAAERAGLRVRDVVIEVNGRAVNDSSDFLEAIDGMEVGDVLIFTVVRDGREVVLRVEVGERPPGVKRAAPGPTDGEPSGQRFPGAFRFRPGAPRDKRPSRPHQTPRQHGTPSSAPRRPARPIIKLQAKPRVGAALTTEQPTRPTAPYVYEEGLEMAE